MSQHTPGPWASFYKRKYDEWYVALPLEESSRTIALCADGIQSENREADARLIASAPDLLATLKEAEAMFRWYGDLHAAKPDHDKAKRNYDMADKCAAAIAKAEGKAP